MAQASVRGACGFVLADNRLRTPLLVLEADTMAANLLETGAS
jgi:hypothetical protein